MSSSGCTAGHTPDAAVDWLFGEDVLIPMPKNFPEKEKDALTNWAMKDYPEKCALLLNKYPELSKYGLKAASSPLPESGRSRSQSPPRPHRKPKPLPRHRRPAGSPAARCPGACRRSRTASRPSAAGGAPRSRTGETGSIVHPGRTV